jgi:hypothetical protein
LLKNGGDPVKNRFKFSENSLKNLGEAHPILRFIAFETLKKGLCDFAVITGYRDEDTQNRLFAEKKSKALYPDSKHNVYPSHAIDIQPFIPGKGYSTNPIHFVYLAGLYLATAVELGYDDIVRWGGNWDMDIEVMTDQDFQDLFHMELVDGFENILRQK